MRVVLSNGSSSLGGVTSSGPRISGKAENCYNTESLDGIAIRAILFSVSRLESSDPAKRYRDTQTRTGLCHASHHPGRADTWQRIVETALADDVDLVTMYWWERQIYSITYLDER